MIDRVELVARHQPGEMREFERDDAFWLEQARHTRDEVIEVRNLSQDVVADDEVGRFAFGHQLLRELDPEEVDERRDAAVDGYLSNVGSRLDTEHGHAQWQEVLQQIAVIARQLDDQAVRPQPEPSCDHLAVCFGVGDPGGRIGGVVGVFSEDGLRADILLQLDEEAAPADEHMKREVRLHRVELGVREKALAQWRHPEIDEGVFEPAAAESATTGRVRARLTRQVRAHLRHCLEN